MLTNRQQADMVKIKAFAHPSTVMACKPVPSVAAAEIIAKALLFMFVYFCEG